ncbi:MAG: asparagine synthase (glutamine-hydrolyzing) [Bacteroidetes bacterium]|nr:asparagine synthase (glutamine-hydrolyzing) [Bacteroidota bacterium]
MCGILTYFKPSGLTKEDINTSLVSLKSIKHRGPDGEGVVLINSKTGTFQILKTDETPAEINSNTTLDSYVDKSADLLFGHRRLSIIDLSANGHQPMFDSESGNWIIFNGEVYNYVEIKQELEGLGYSFRTKTDTEVVLKAYHKWGKDCLSRFNGMFSIVIYDKNTRQLFIANDRFSVKPLYYYSTTQEHIISSEIKQIVHYQNVDLTLSGSVINKFTDLGILDYDYKTFYTNIFRFKWAHYTFVSLTEQQVISAETQKCYYTIQPNHSNYGKSDAEIFEQFKWLLTDAIRLRLRSDVPVGFALSGGLDSTAVTAIAKKTLLPNNEKFHAFSVVFPGSSEDESSFIKIAADDLKIKYHSVNPLEFFTIDDFILQTHFQDSPIQTFSFYAQYRLYKLVHEQGIKVLINGQGADEYLGGYHHHFYAYLKFLVKKGKVGSYLNEANSYSVMKEKPASFYHKLVYNSIKYDIKLASKSNNKLNRVELAEKADKTLNHKLIRDLTEHTIPVYVKCDDRDAMAFSVESRHPFLDYRLVDYCFTIPDSIKIRDGWQKCILRESVKELPLEIKYRKDKKGFPTPQSKLMQMFPDEIADFSKISNQHGYFSSDKFREFSLGVWLNMNKK